MVADEYPKRSSESDAPKWYLQFFENYQPLWGDERIIPPNHLKGAKLAPFWGPGPVG